MRVTMLSTAAAGVNAAIRTPLEAVQPHHDSIKFSSALVREAGMKGPGEPSTLFEVRYPGKSSSSSKYKPDTDAALSSAEWRERAAIRRAGIWGIVLSTAAVLLGSLLMSMSRGGG